MIMTLLFWASAFVGIRIGLQDYSPGALALLRFLVASVSTGIIFIHIPRKNPMSWRIRGQLALIGVLAIGIYNLCLNIGEQTVSAGIASFVIGLMPVITILLAVVFLKERFNGGVWVGVLISLLGLLLLIFGEKDPITLNGGVLSILIAALMGALYSILQKPFLRHYHPVAVTAWVIWGGTLMLMIFLPPLYQEFSQASLKTTLAVIYLGIFPGALAYVGWTYVLSHFSASRASVYLYALPILSTLMGMVLLQEHLAFYSAVGGLLALFGAYVANRFTVKG